MGGDGLYEILREDRGLTHGPREARNHIEVHQRALEAITTPNDQPCCRSEVAPRGVRGVPGGQHALRGERPTKQILLPAP